MPVNLEGLAGVDWDAVDRAASCWIVFQEIGSARLSQCEGESDADMLRRWFGLEFETLAERTAKGES